ncbi:hypothetical protein LSAT2_027211 [Lamellibrachia satsuma]|nr:hypothetical protein LSAT2_027211 [Lamellibrachia satsuma]
MDELVVNNIRTIKGLDKAQYNNYHKSVIVDHSHSILDPIKKNSMAIFKCPTPQAKTKQAGKLSKLNNDVALFSQLYIMMQHRDCNMSTFFSHENRPYLLSLCDWQATLQKKSDLLTILVQKGQREPPTSFDVKALDGAARFVGR